MKQNLKCLALGHKRTIYRQGGFIIAECKRKGCTDKMVHPA